MSINQLHRVTTRHPVVQQRYEDWLVSASHQHGNSFCTFCSELRNHQVIRSLQTMFVIENRFPYEFFDGQAVKQHYLIVPLRHTDRFSQFTHREYEEYHEVLAAYHDQGFSSMTRSVVDTHRSVPGHLHTHLLTYN